MLYSAFFAQRLLSDAETPLPERAAAAHDRPDNARELVGDGDRHHPRRSPRQQRVHPPGELRFVLGVTDHSRGAENQEPSKIGLAPLRYAAKMHLAAGAVLLWHQAKPG